MPRTLVCYSYFEQKERVRHLQFFLREGLSGDPEIEFAFVLQGGICSLPIPEQPNIHVIRRTNEGFDFGAHAAAIEDAAKRHNTDVKHLPYDSCVFLNDGAVGPFLPSYFPKDRHWTSIFSDRMSEVIKLVGTSIVCLPESDSGGPGPKVEGFCFSLDRVGLRVCLDRGTIFTNHRTKRDAIIHGEYGVSRAILEAGYSMDCLLYRYQGLDWRSPENWKLNECIHPSREGTYGGISIHPFEVVFHKPVWTYEGRVVSRVNDASTYAYLNWRLRGE